MITIQFNDDEVRARLGLLARRLDDMTPVMADIGEQLLVSTKERFGQGKSPEGAPWAPKSPTTLAAYERRNDRADPRPLFGPSRRLSSEIVVRPWRKYVEIGSNLAYAAAMQFGMAKGYAGRTSRGGPIPWGNIPARPFLGLSAKDRTDILDIIGDWMDPGSPAGT